MKRLPEQKGGVIGVMLCQSLSCLHTCRSVEQREKNEQGFMIQQNYYTKLSLLVHLTLKRK